MNRTISTEFWGDSKVEEFSPEDRYVLLYILTAPNGNLCGCFEITYRRMSHDLGYTVDMVENIVNRLISYGVIDYDKETHELLIKNWNRYNWTKSSKLDKPLIEQIDGIHSLKLKKYVIDVFNSVREIPYPYGIDTVSEVDDNCGYLSTSISKPITKSSNKGNRFQKPTIDEIQGYMDERGYVGFTAQRFFDYYESNGWKVGRNNMKDWKAAVRTWGGKEASVGSKADARSADYSW